MIRFIDKWNDSISVSQCDDGEYASITVYPNNDQQESITVLLDVRTAILFSKELRKVISEIKNQ